MRHTRFCPWHHFSKSSRDVCAHQRPLLLSLVTHPSTRGAVAWHTHSGSLRIAEKTIVRMARLCMHLRRPDGEDWLCQHKRTWRLGKQAVVESWGATPTARGPRSSAMHKSVRVLRARRLVRCRSQADISAMLEDRETDETLRTGSGERCRGNSVEERRGLAE